jgi:hypothetical protein
VATLTFTGRDRYTTLRGTTWCSGDVRAVDEKVDVTQQQLTARPGADSLHRVAGEADHSQARSLGCARKRRDRVKLIEGFTAEEGQPLIAGITGVHHQLSRFEVGATPLGEQVRVDAPAASDGAPLNPDRCSTPRAFCRRPVSDTRHTEPTVRTRDVGHSQVRPAAEAAAWMVPGSQ